MKLSIAFLLLAGSAQVMATEWDPAECGPAGMFAIAGSSTVLPVAELWVADYQKNCTGVNITTEGGGSSAGAGRVCNNTAKGTAVEIGDMSRGWKASEAMANETMPYLYHCLKGDTTRSAIQIDVAIDGLSVVAKKDGAGDKCITSLGGLTTDQLRWIFSSHPAANLTATGWEAASLPNSDGDDTTHLWSELKDDPDCPAAEIVIVGPDSESGTYEYFSETVFGDLDNGETFRDAYLDSHLDEVLAAEIDAREDAIAYFGYAYFNANSDTLSAAAIMNGDGMMVAPNSTTVGDGSYNPLARRIFMNLLDEADSLDMTAPFIKFGFSDEGSVLVEETGYVVIPDTDKASMLERVGYVANP